MLGTTGKISGRLEANRTDIKGRWTWVQLTGKKDKQVLVVSAYRVSQSYPREAGYSTAYMQQYRAYIKDNVSKPKPKHKFLVDLASFLLTWKHKHEDSSIILMMDANGDRSDPHFYTFLQETVLHDTVAHFSPNLKEQSTYINGRKRLDYILVTEELLAAGTRAGHT